MSSSFIKKLIANNFVTVFTGLPNLAINLATQAVLDVGFHWSGWLGPGAYLVGLVFSVQYSVLFNMLTKSNFTILGHKWSFSHKKESE